MPIGACRLGFGNRVEEALSGILSKLDNLMKKSGEEPPVVIEVQLKVFCCLTLSCMQIGLRTKHCPLVASILFAVGVLINLLFNVFLGHLRFSQGVVVFTRDSKLVLAGEQPLVILMQSIWYASNTALAATSGYYRWWKHCR